MIKTIPSLLSAASGDQHCLKLFLLSFESIFEGLSNFSPFHFQAARACCPILTQRGTVLYLGRHLEASSILGADLVKLKSAQQR